MKYMLLISFNPTTWESLSEEDRQAVLRGHQEFMEVIRESGELIETRALGDPSTWATVKVRGGAPVETDGPHLEAKEHFAGYYLVDCESPERACELAAMIRDAKYTAMEVRPVVHEAGMEM